jgi:hypothetical protein
MQSRAIVVLLLVGMAALAVERDFVLPLKLTNAQISAVFLGCRDNATDGFDRNYDEPAPPPGMQTGYVGFIGTLQNTLMRKDIKAHGDMKEWKFYIQAYDGKPFRMSWEKALLPKYYHLSLVTADKELDMAKTTQFETADSQTVAFVALLDADKLAAAKRAEEVEAAEAKLASAKTEEPAPAPKATPASKAEPEPVAPTPDPKRVTGGVTLLIVAMGALLLLIVIFAAVRR